MYAYSMPKTKLAVYDRLKYQVYQSVCLAICECHGLLTMMQKDKSFDNDSFFEMLESIRDAAGDEKKIYVMLDNARFHSLDNNQKKRLKSLDINMIWNVPYRFDF